ncbi:hotdog fold thioesterase [Clostridium chromiireducens]|uniref:Hotdog fold thioesterase n=1 Tax=Clostridium chromiireducens TaxID=225345 RepID=A0A964RSB9_9CLOT|nr:PaaI family thioesterase [Clostridium chromiireducens]MVX66673.1 hotdog fold thioesterase [Clostridium chromiireducens]
MTKHHLLWLENYLKETYQTSILENFLNLQIDEISEGKVKYKTKIIDKHCNIYGYVHGGTLASIADVVMGVSCVTLGKRIVTTDLSISYIKNVREGNIITAVGEVISDGNNIMRAVCKIFDESQELLVQAQASYFVIGSFDNIDYPKSK